LQEAAYYSLGLKPREFWELTSREFLLLYWGKINDQRHKDWRRAWTVFYTAQNIRRGTTLASLYKELQPADNTSLGTIKSEEDGKEQFREIFDSPGNESALKRIEERLGRKMEMITPEGLN